MGSNFSRELASGELNFLTDGFLPLDRQMQLHLTGNIYPPAPVSMVIPCVQAIEAYWGDECEKVIELPAQVTWKGQNSAPAFEIIEGFKLHSWTVEYDYDAELN